MTEPAHVAFFNVATQADRNYLAERLPADRITPTFFAEPFNRQTAARAARAVAVSGFIHSRLTADALDEGLLAGAGLDVLEGEEHLQDELQGLDRTDAPDRLRQLVYTHALLRRPDVIFTPHMAFNSREAVLRILQTTVENIMGFLGDEPQNLVVPTT